MITIAESIAVSKSETGIEYNTPSSPKNRGNIIAKPTPNTISRTIESKVDERALPIACKNINAVLLMQAKIIIQRYILNAFTAKSV